MLIVATLIGLLCGVHLTVSDQIHGKGHMEPLGNSGSKNRIDVSDGYPSPTVFINQYLKVNRPLLMKGALKDSPAFQKWTDRYLMKASENHPDAYVLVENGKKENRTKAATFLHFGEFLESYNTSDIYMVNPVPRFLESEVIMPGPVQCKDLHDAFDEGLMWFSSGGTKSVIHLDGYENINCVYRGDKEFVLVNTTKYENILNNILDSKDFSFSTANVEKIDLQKYPFFSEMEFYKVRVSAGDCLYLPIRWLHNVNSIGSNIAVNIWWNKGENITVDPDKCNKEMDKSLSMSKIRFNRLVLQETTFDLTEELLDLVWNYTSISETGTTTRDSFIRGFIPDHESLKNYKNIIMSTLERIFTEVDLNNDGIFDAEESETLSQRSPSDLIDLSRLSVQWEDLVKKFNSAYPDSEVYLPTSTNRKDKILPGKDEGNGSSETIEYMPKVDEHIRLDLGEQLFVPK